MNDEIIYLDHAAGTPLDDRVLEAMQPYFTDKFFNPSSPYAPAVKVRREYEKAKQKIAESIGGKGADIIMTAGATESVQMMFASVSGHVIVPSIEHQSVLEAAKKHDYTIVEPDQKGFIRAEVVAKAIRPDTELVSVQLANNELGTIEPLREIAEIIKIERQRRFEAGEKHPIYLHSDASQGLGQIDINVARLGLDAITLNAGKIYGPKQVGCLWVNSSVRLRPLILGGGQEKGLRSGTENVAGVIGFAKAIELAVAHTHSESKRLSGLRDSLQERLTSAFPDAVVSGSLKRRLPGHLHISFPNLDAERLIFSLEMQGVLVATGSACAANKHTRSHVLKAIGMPTETADGSLRLTLGRLTNETNILKSADIIELAVKREMERIRT